MRQQPIDLSRPSKNVFEEDDASQKRANPWGKCILCTINEHLMPVSNDLSSMTIPLRFGPTTFVIAETAPALHTAHALPAIRQNTAIAQQIEAYQVHR